MYSLTCPNWKIYLILICSILFAKDALRPEAGWEDTGCCWCIDLHVPCHFLAVYCTCLSLWKATACKVWQPPHAAHSMLHKSYSLIVCRYVIDSSDLGPLSRLFSQSVPLKNVLTVAMFISFLYTGLRLRINLLSSVAWQQHDLISMSKWKDKKTHVW